MHRQISGRLVIATHNPGKLAEMRELLAPYGIEAVSAGELGLAEPEETGTTFAENARIKARAAAQAASLPALRRRFRLVVDALDGAPGIYSARWAGPNKDFARAMARIERLLRERGATTRRQRERAFRLRAVRRLARRPCRGVRGAVDGTLVWPPRGTAGFGYDPMFLPDGHTRTFGEMTERGEARPAAAGLGLSHRARAFVKLAEACLERALTREAFGVYVHWPFCLSKCPYCDFNSHVRHAADRRGALSRAPSRARSPPPPRACPAARCRAIFFGGGTPSLMQPPTVGAILDAIGQHWTRRARRRGHARGQSRPASRPTRFRGYRAAGVNRVSLGVQALDDAALKELGRLHTRARGARRGRDRAQRRSSAIRST